MGKGRAGMRRAAQLVTAIAVAGALAIAAACGGGGDGRQLTAKEYAAELSTICQGFTDAQARIGTVSSNVVERGTEVVEAYDEALTATEALEPPDELADTVDEFITRGEEQRDSLADLLDASKDGDVASAGELSHTATGAAAAFAAGAAACGGEDWPTADQFTARVNSICEDLNAKWDEIGEPKGTRDIVVVGQRTVGALDKAIAGVEELDLRSEVRADALDEFRAKRVAQRELIAGATDAFEAEDYRGLVDLSEQAEHLDEEADALAEEMGATACTA